MTAFAPIRHHDTGTPSGFAILHGSFAPAGCVVRLDGFTAQIYDAPARVFDAADDAVQAIMGGRVRAGDCVIIRCDDCNGMCDLSAVMRALDDAALDRVTVISDSRLGTTGGAVIGHVAPSAAARGPIAYVQDDDILHIDIPARRIDVLADIDIRRAARAQKPGKATFGAGALEKYARLFGETR